MLSVTGCILGEANVFSSFYLGELKLMVCQSWEDDAYSAQQALYFSSIQIRNGGSFFKAREFP